MHNYIIFNSRNLIKFCKISFLINYLSSLNFSSEFYTLKATKFNLDKTSSECYVNTWKIQILRNSVQLALAHMW